MISRWRQRASASPVVLGVRELLRRPQLFGEGTMDRIPALTTTRRNPGIDQTASDIVRPHLFEMKSVFVRGWFEERFHR